MGWGCLWKLPAIDFIASILDLDKEIFRTLSPAWTNSNSLSNEDCPPPIFALLVLLSTGSCGNLFLSSEKEVMMVSSPDAAGIWVNGVRLGTTPMQLELNNRISHNVVFRKEGYSDMSCQLNSTVHGGIVVLDVLAGLVPVIIDAATGGWKRIPEDSCTVTLPSDNG